MIYCTNCGNEIDEDSKFCPFCGVAVVKNEESTHEEPQEDNLLWDKFVEIRDSKDEKKTKFQNFIPDEAWILMKNMQENTLVELKEKYPDEIGNLPYKAVDLIASYFSIATLDGYWVHLAKRLLDNPRLKKAKNLKQDAISARWQKEIIKDIYKVGSPEEINILYIIDNLDIGNALEDEQIKELPNKVIEDLKSYIYRLTYWGFVLCVAEEKLQK